MLSAYFSGVLRGREVREILGAFEVFLGICKKTKEKKDREQTRTFSAILSLQLLRDTSLATGSASGLQRDRRFERLSGDNGSERPRTQLGLYNFCRKSITLH